MLLLPATLTANEAKVTLRMLQQALQSEGADEPVVVDAGLGVPSDAAEAMEVGADAVLVNTAIAVASDPVVMARAFALATQAGRLGFLARPGAVRDGAEASSPLTGFLS